MKNSGRKKKTLIALLLILLLVMVSGSCIVALNYSRIFSHPPEISSVNSTKTLDENGNAIDGTVPSKTQDEILKELQDKQINVTDKLSSHILFPDGKAGTEGSWIVENVAANTVAIQCEVYLGDRMIAKSVPIKPDQHIDTIVLSEDVDPGQYDAIAYINYYDLDSGVYLAKAGFKISLTIQ